MAALLFSGQPREEDMMPRSKSEPVVVVGVRLPEPIYEALKRHAAAGDRTISATVRTAIRAWLLERD